MPPKDSRRGALASEMRGMLHELLAAPALPYVALLILPYAGLLLGLDIAAHYGALTHAPLPVEFYLSSDGGFGEWLEYALTGSIAVMLLLLWWRERDTAYLANSMLFAWLMIDNSAEIHERTGHWLAPWIENWNVLPVGANDIGEAALFLLIGLLWLGGLAASIRRARLRPMLHSLLLAGCVAGTALFGVIVDMMVVWGQQSATLHETETFIEDAGEFAMIILAFLIVAAIFDIERRRGAGR